MVKMYTDGAVSNNGYENAMGGCAYLILKDGEITFSYGWALPQSTNNKCEMMAIIRGCQRIEKEYPSESKIEVYSDSAYCINCYKQQWYKKWMVNGWINSKNQPVKNKELWELLIPFFEDNRFTFIKVKGHSNDEYNNMVDKMAVEARLIQNWVNNREDEE